MKFYYVTNIFDLKNFDNETTTVLKTFEISTEMHFVSLFFLNESYITSSLLMIHLKCTAVHDANLKSSYTNKPLLNYEPSKMLLPFFSQVFIYVYFHEAFVKKLNIKKLSFFITNLQNSFQDLLYYRILGCFRVVLKILKRRKHY